MVQKAMCTDYRAVMTSPAAKWALVCLMMVADDSNGNASLNMQFLKTKVLVGQKEADIESWIEELTEKGFLSPYVVNGEPYTSIVDWKSRDGLTFQYIEKTKMQGWVNPTPHSDNKAKTAATPSRKKDEQVTKVRRPRIDRLGNETPLERLRRREKSELRLRTTPKPPEAVREPLRRKKATDVWNPKQGSWEDWMKARSS